MPLQTRKVETPKNTNKFKKKKTKKKFRRNFAIKIEDDPFEENKMLSILRRDGREGPIRREGLQIERHKKTEFSFNSLNPYMIAKQLQELEKYFPDKIITQEIIGRTAEYNDIVLLKIKNKISYVRKNTKTVDNEKYEDEVPENKIIFIVHGLSVMGFTELPCFFKTYSFLQLLDIYLQFSHVFHIYLIPMANPDGVAFAKQFWNKNMSPQRDCLGVALDRNFDVAWNNSRKVNSCSQQYPGAFPFSEQETRAIRDVFHRYSSKMAAYFHVHAGTFYDGIFKGDAVLHPKGFTNVPTEDDKYTDLKGEIEETMKNASFCLLTMAVETLHNWYGPVSGTSVDYASTVYGIPYAMELSMQLYENSSVDESAEKETNIALLYVWRPIIEVIFEKIYDALESKSYSL